MFKRATMQADTLWFSNGNIYMVTLSPLYHCKMDISQCVGESNTYGNKGPLVDSF